MIKNILCSGIEFTIRSISFWGYDIYYYAIIITSGMIVAIIVMSLLLKTKGYPKDQSLDYAIIVLPCAVIGCRIYFLLFPYSGISYSQFEASWTWENFWAIRDGGLGIYGGVILGYLGAWGVCKFKKQNWSEIVDTIVPGLLIAQSMGRYGNYINSLGGNIEGMGNVVTNTALQFFPYAVDLNGTWYQATFFYESVFTLIGFIVCLLLLKDEKYRDGWCLSFYGIYYGCVRLVIEGFRSDSLYLRVPLIWSKTFWETGIKISQFVSIIAIVLGVVRLIYMYRSEIKGLLSGKKLKQQ